MAGCTTRRVLFEGRWAAGVEVEREAREVTVYGLTLLEWTPPTLGVEVQCGRGFYMRTFAHGLGLALGCYAYLSELTRVRAAAFTLEDAMSPAELEAAADSDRAFSTRLRKCAPRRPRSWSPC